MMGTKELSLACAVGALVSVMALDAMAAKKAKIDGKEMFKANCKICHDKGSASGEYTPMTLIIV